MTPFYVDPTYTGGGSNGSASQPWVNFSLLATDPVWATINAALALDNVTVYFSARQAAADISEVITTSINIWRTDTSTHRLTLDGWSKYNANDAAPNWLAYSGNNFFHIALDGSDAIALGVQSDQTNYPCHYTTFYGFELSGLNARFVFAGNHTIALYVWSHDVTGLDPAILFPNAVYPTCDPWWGNLHDITIQYCTIERCTGEAIYFGGNYIRVEDGGCQSWGNTHYNILIDSNLIIDPGFNGGQADGIDLKAGLHEITVSNNTIRSTDGGARAAATGARGIVSSGVPDTSVPAGYVFDSNLVCYNGGVSIQQNNGVQFTNNLIVYGDFVTDTNTSVRSKDLTFTNNTILLGALVLISQDGATIRNTTGPWALASHGSSTGIDSDDNILPSNVTFDNWTEGAGTVYLDPSNPAFDVPTDCTQPTPPDPPEPVDDCPDSSRTGLYTTITLTQALADLGRRLYDPNSVFWTDAEKTLYLQEALRTFAAMTSTFRETFRLYTFPNQVWYNLATITDSLREFTVTDVDLYTLIEYQLLEPATGATWTGTNQFTIQDLVKDVQIRRDQLLADTGCTLVRSTQFTNTTVVNTLCENTIDIRRIAYLPVTRDNSPLWRDDNWAQQSYNRNRIAAGTPNIFKQSTQPRLEFFTDVPPAVAGEYELLTVNAGAVLTAASPTILNIPNDWTWVLKYGAEAELLNRESAARDPIRAAYCEQRYRLGVALMRQSPAVLDAEIDYQQLNIDAVQMGDDFRPGWQAEPPGDPDAMYLAGLNYLALAPTPETVVPVLITLLANSPFPSTGSGYLQIGREDYDAILDLAQHIAAFKQGGAEFQATMPLLKEFLAHCALYNNKLATMGEYTDIMYGQSQLQEQADPRLARTPEDEN